MAEQAFAKFVSQGTDLVEVAAMRIGALIATAVLALGAGTGSDMRAEETRGLRSASAFAGMTDRDARSRALFTEASKVLTSPRCINCHPAGDHPLQGNDQRVHYPPVSRRVGELVALGRVCNQCHTDRNVRIFAGQANFKSIPGHPRWDLAPVEMAWQGKSVSEICTQLKDPARNGGRSLAVVQEHLAHDDLIAWGWNPGPGRDPAPGTQAQLGELIQAWIDTGARCP
jgi:hypothetical protein